MLPTVITRQTREIITHTAAKKTPNIYFGSQDLKDPFLYDYLQQKTKSKHSCWMILVIENNTPKQQETPFSSCSFISKKRKSKTNIFVQIHPLALDMEPSEGTASHNTKDYTSLLYKRFSRGTLHFWSSVSLHRNTAFGFSQGLKPRAVKRPDTAPVPPGGVLVERVEMRYTGSICCYKRFVTKADRSLRTAALTLNFWTSPFGRRRPYDFFHIYKKVAFRILIRL